MTNKKSSDKKENNSLAPTKSVSAHNKVEGQVGLHAPNNINAIRRAKPQDRQDKGERFIGGISEPQVAPQTYDVYNPIPKTKKSSEQKKS